jgi:hypothetical protein
VTIHSASHSAIPVSRAKEANPAPPASVLAADQELQLLCRRYGYSGDRRSVERWPVDRPLEGWLQLEGEGGAAFPLILIDFSTAGVVVAFSMHRFVWPGQCGDLITQSHGAGCCHRPVCCRWQRFHGRNRELRCAGLGFLLAA